MQSWSAYIKSIFVQPYEIYESCFITDLPLELFLSICDLLPYEDLVCFSLCNHGLFNLLKAQKRRMSHTRDDILSLINRLEQDLPGHFACEICLILHEFEELENLDWQGFPNLVCEAKWRKDPMVFTSHQYKNYVPPFSLIHVKLAMKRFYRGPRYGISTDCLEYTQVRHCSVDAKFHGRPDLEVRDPDFTLLFSRNLAVCHRPLGLYMRTQDIVTFKRKWDHAFLHSPDSTCPLAFLSLCHVSVCHIVAPLIEHLCKSGQLDYSITFPYTCST